MAAYLCYRRDYLLSNNKNSMLASVEIVPKELLIILLFLLH